MDSLSTNHDYVARIAELEAKLRQAEAERDGYHQTLNELLSPDKHKLVSYSPEEGWQFSTPLVPKLAESLGQMLEEANAQNFVEFQMYHKKAGMLVFTVQRREGKTPAQLRSEALDRIKVLEMKLEDHALDAVAKSNERVNKARAQRDEMIEAHAQLVVKHDNLVDRLMKAERDAAEWCEKWENSGHELLDKDAEVARLQHTIDVMRENQQLREEARRGKYLIREEEYDGLMDALMKARDFIEFSGIFGTPTTALVGELDALLANHDRKGQWHTESTGSLDVKAFRWVPYKKENQ